eukprot:TRINITY_DN142_c0_g1_i2.p1 TRINITY_DN142_c0_g1~~TRINITY_DN142_c0_g1_i2.p1  ORF type:complete len:702 (-),score=280.60 TRINITY_DN142_c0_g1_i2:9-2114(-)
MVPASIQAGVDLTDTVCNHLRDVMFAQAHECMFHTLVSTSNKHKLVAMTANRIASCYETAYSTASESKLLNKVLPKDWMPQLFVLSLFYKAIANFRTGQELDEKGSYGEGLARFTLAKSLIDKAVSACGKNVASATKTIVEKQADEITIKYTEAERDNSKVYLEMVPSTDKLEPIRVAPEIKPIPPADLDLGIIGIGFGGGEGSSSSSSSSNSGVSEDNEHLGTGLDPFAELVPMEVMQAVSLYSQRKDDTVRKLLDHLQAAVVSAQGTLAELNLPASIEALETTKGLPQALEDKIRDIQGKGGANALFELMKQTQRQAEINMDVFSQAADALNEEEQEDSIMREQFGAHRWDRKPSRELNGNFKAELRRNEEYMEHAAKSDNFLKQKLESKAESFQRISAPISDIVQEIPDTSNSGDTSSKVKEISNNLKLLLQKLHQNKMAGDEIGAEIKAMSMSDNVLSKLMKTKSTYENVYQEELKKYGEFNEKIEENIVAQTQLLSQIADENRAFVEARECDDNQNKKQSIFLALEVACNDWKELASNLKQGSQFYGDLHSILKKLNQEILDFVTVRRMQRQDMLTDLSHDLSGNSSSKSELYSNLSSKPSSSSSSSSSSSIYDNPPQRPLPEQPSNEKDTSSNNSNSSNSTDANGNGDNWMMQKTVETQMVQFACFNCKTQLQTVRTATTVVCPICNQANRLEIK